MEDYKLKIIESVVVVLLYIIIKYSTAKSLVKVAMKHADQKTRFKLIKKLINVFMFIIGIGILLSIWGIDQSRLVFFISSVLTILGVAFFASWSLISNITAAIIIFFSHPAKIGDSITVLDKEYQIEGRISDIGIFFMIIKTAAGEKISVPNNIFMQKMVRRNTKD